MAKLKRCNVIVIGLDKRRIKCGMPLDTEGKCPDHGRPR